MITKFTFSQLEYLVAIDTWRHFGVASEKCFVTQPTLSMQIQKMERDLSIQLFDRSKQPVVPTEAGKVIIEQARLILKEAGRMQEQVADLKGNVEGELKLGVIPTIAPYLLPLFITKFLLRYPKIRLVIHELITETIIERLKNGRLDAGLLSTPLNEPSIKEDPLFYEEFMVYHSKNDSALNKKFVLPGDIDIDKLWLLEEGHCFRSQIMNLCELKKVSGDEKHFDYQTGSLETLKLMVELNHGITILPQLALKGLSLAQLKKIRQFKPPAPVREISLVTHRNFVKMKIISALKSEIMDAIPDVMKKNTSKAFPPV